MACRNSQDREITKWGWAEAGKRRWLFSDTGTSFCWEMHPPSCLLCLHFILYPWPLHAGLGTDWHLAAEALCTLSCIEDLGSYQLTPDKPSRQKCWSGQVFLLVILILVPSFWQKDSLLTLEHRKLTGYSQEYCFQNLKRITSYSVLAMGKFELALHLLLIPVPPPLPSLYPEE